MNKKTVRNLIIAGTVGLTATTVGLTTALTACSTTATQTFSAESITNLKSAITNAISSEKLTRSEFSKDMVSFIRNNFSANEENMGGWVKFATFSPNNENEILITLKSDAKYSLPEDFKDESVDLSGDLLSITFDELNFYQAISFNADDLRNNVLNAIESIGVGNFDTYVTEQINDFQTSNNTNLGNYINTPTYSQETNSINITLKDDIGLYKFNPVSLEGVQITKNEITLTGISLEASPESWFTWGTGANANQITGLSSLGLQQENIVLPAKATSIIKSAFNNKSNLVSVDMSLTQITNTPNNGNDYGILQGCLNLKNLALPKNITNIENYFITDDRNIKYILIPESVTSIGKYVFRNNGLISITIPSKVTSIGESAFLSCTSLTSITILSPSISFSTDAFKNVPSTCVATVKNATVQQAMVNAGFKGIININPNLN